jgi:hypothetical protein
MKAKTQTWTIAIFGVVLLLVIGMFTGFGGLMSSTDTPVDADGNVIVTTSSCELAPSLTTNVKNAFAQATSVTTSEVYRVNGEYFSTLPSLAKGDKVQILANASGYIDVLSDEVTIDCGANTVSLKTEQYTAPTIEVKEDNTQLTDSATGGAENGTAVTSGGSESFTYSIKGADKRTTGDMIVVIEAGKSQNVSLINMYDSNGQTLEEVSVPDFYVETLTSPEVIAYKVPAVVGAVEKAYTINFVADSGDTITGAVYTTTYVGEPLAEDDGTFTPFGVANADGEADYEATFDYDFFLA